MTPWLARWLISLYPPEWRQRYGEEFQSLLQDGPGGVRALLDVLRGAIRERLVTPITLGLAMNHYPDSVISLSRKPSAFVPLAMSLTALAVVLGSVSVFGVVHEPDEGAVAHIWQLLMAGQVPILAYFLIRWLPRVPRQALYVLALQIAAALAALAPVYWLGL